MSDNKIPGIWKWSFVLLILCNFGLLLTIWLKPFIGGDRDHRERPRNYVIEQLKFTDEQVKKYDLLIKDHRSSMDRLREEAMSLRNQLFSNLKNETGEVNVDSLAQLIATNQKMIETVTYDHFNRVRALCTNEQKQGFDKIITEVINKMNGGMHGGGPHPHDGNGPPPNAP